ncbi:hypothetical protein RU09_11860 [Microbacterium sp. MEJ108Y]|uniref:hypothetical protein n=1 Tax=Microbacterium sp. MEJ108Y TaxID=1587523 RepID=UPI0005AC7863|nr:hypothetical protein [Microbacterium sp. MEJ108Y]KIP90169.1 hypothetical protein RU09_11860 [Microbacterium sp. MEJ108Y]
MSDERLTEARKALARYEDRNSKPNPAHLADAIRGLMALVEELTEPEAEPCDAEIWSWDIFRHQQVDPYWMRCHKLGAHDEHENSETGAHWPVKLQETAP